MLTEEAKQNLFELNPGALLADGFEEAYIGVCNRFGMEPLAAYDYDKCVDILMKRNGSTYEEAGEFFDFNVMGAWCGDGTPVFIEKVKCTPIDGTPVEVERIICLPWSSELND